jgi:hypothetical protein
MTLWRTKSDLLLKLSLLLLLIYSGAVTSLYLKSTKEPSPFAEALAPSTEADFLNFFIESYFRIDPGQYAPAQLALTLLMNESLAEKRKQEIFERTQQLSQERVQQKPQILFLQKGAALVRSTVLVVLLKNEGSEKVYVDLELKFEPTQKTKDNPWGFVVTAFEITKLNLEQTSSSPEELLRLQDLESLILIPCPVQKVISSVPLNQFENELVSSSTSRFRFKAASDILDFEFVCEEESFKKSTRLSTHTHTYILGLQPHEALRKTLSKKEKPKSVFEKKLEDELGFIILSQ